MDKIIVQKIKVQPLIEFIEKVISIDKFIYIKINNGNMVSNCYLPERDAVKLHSVQVDDILETDSLPDKQLKLAFLNGSHTIDALKQFIGSQVSAEIEYKMIGEDYTAVLFKLISDDLIIDLPCSDPSLGFMDMTSEQIKTVFDTNNPLFEFEVEPYHIENLNNLFKLEKEKEIFKIVINSTGVRFKGNLYNKLVTDMNKSEKEHSVTFYKKYLNFLDKETYKISVFEHKSVWQSLDSDTMLCIATCSSND